MKKVLLITYHKIGEDIKKSIEQTFYKAVFLQLSSYVKGGSYGILFDLPDAACYRSYIDSSIEDEIKHCCLALPKYYKERLFVAIRPRRYRLKRGTEYCFSCDGGEKGALIELLQEKNEYIFLLGEKPSSFSYLYFSSACGLLEAGGIYKLINKAETKGKNILPRVKISKNFSSYTKTGKKNSFFALNSLKGTGIFCLYEGLYIKNNNSVKALSKDKTNQCSFLLANDIYVLDIPIQEKINFPPVQSEKDETKRFYYRTALACSRIFTSILEKPTYLPRTSSDIAIFLTALIPLNTFGFLGKHEIIEYTDILLDTLGTSLYSAVEINDPGKLTFLLSTLELLYSLYANSNSHFWSFKLRASHLLTIVKESIAHKFVIYDKVFLDFCYKEQEPKLSDSPELPPLISAFLSNAPCDLIALSCKNLNDPETSLCSLICAANLCFNSFFKAILYSAPVFSARCSLLKRSNKCFNAKSYYTQLSSHPANQSFFGIPFSLGLTPITDRFSSKNISPDLFHHAVYLESICSYFADNNQELVTICFISPIFNSLTQNLIKARQLFPKLSLTFIFDSTDAFSKAKREHKTNVTLLSSAYTDECKKAVAKADYVARLTPFSTLSELLGKIKTNAQSLCKSQPHSSDISP